jgi:hypothetical protein
MDAVGSRRVSTTAGSTSPTSRVSSTNGSMGRSATRGTNSSTQPLSTAVTPKTRRCPATGRSATVR